MKKISSFISISFFMGILFPGFSPAWAQLCSIDFKISGADGKKGFFGFYFEKERGLVGEFTFDSKGMWRFEQKENLLKGIYFIAVDSFYFDFLIPDDQVFELQTKYPDFPENMKVKGSNDNEIFFVHQNKNIVARRKIEKLHNKIKSNTQDSAKINREIRDLETEVEQQFEETAKKYPKSFYTKLIRAMQALALPADSIVKIIDFSESGLIRTPFYHNVLRYHIAANIDEAPASIIRKNNELLALCSQNDTLLNYTTWYLSNFYRNYCKTGFNNVYVALAENLLNNQQGNFKPDSVQKKALESSISFFRASNIGQKAYAFKALSESGDSAVFPDSKSKYTFLFFWSLGCGHCEKAGTVLKENYDMLKSKDIEIFGFVTDAKKPEEVVKKTAEQAYQWMNYCDILDIYETKSYYYVCSTPQLFVVDSEGFIVNKMYGEEQIAAFIQEIRK